MITGRLADLAESSVAEATKALPHKARRRPARIVAAAEEITATEDRIREAVAAGEPLVAVRDRLRYHDLQTKR